MDNLSTDTIHVDNATLVWAAITTFIEGFESGSGVAIATSAYDVWVPSNAIEETQDLDERVREGEFRYRSKTANESGNTGRLVSEHLRSRDHPPDGFAFDADISYRNGRVDALGAS